MSKASVACAWLDAGGVPCVSVIWVSSHVIRFPNGCSSIDSRRTSGVKGENETCQIQCDETYVAPANAAGMAKLSRMRFVSATGVEPNRRLNSLLNWDGLV